MDDKNKGLWSPVLGNRLMITRDLFEQAFTVYHRQARRWAVSADVIEHRDGFAASELDVFLPTHDWRKHTIEKKNYKLIHDTFRRHRTRIRDTFLNGGANTKLILRAVPMLEFTKISPHIPADDVRTYREIEFSCDWWRDEHTGLRIRVFGKIGDGLPVLVTTFEG